MPKDKRDVAIWALMKISEVAVASTAHYERCEKVIDALLDLLKDEPTGTSTGDFTPLTPEEEDNLHNYWVLDSGKPRKHTREEFLRLFETLYKVRQDAAEEIRAEKERSRELRTLSLDMQKRAEEAQAEASKMKDAWLRTAADFDNYRKRQKEPPATRDLRLEAIAAAHGWRSWSQVVEDSQRDGYTEAGGRGNLAAAIGRTAMQAQELINLVNDHWPKDGK